MAYKLKRWQVKDVKTGRITGVLLAKTRRSLVARLGAKRASEVEITLVG